MDANEYETKKQKALRYLDEVLNMIMSVNSVVGGCSMFPSLPCPPRVDSFGWLSFLSFLAGGTGVD
jgi:hypothetical protein